MTDNSFEKLVISLVDILNKEIENLGQIKKIEEDKFNLLSTKKLIDLSPQNECLEKLLIKQASFEQKREIILNQFGQFYNNRSITLRELANNLSHDDKSNLLEKRQILKKITVDIKSLSDTNKIILNDLIKIVGYSIDLFTKEQNLETNYGSKMSDSKRCKSLIVNAVI